MNFKRNLTVAAVAALLAVPAFSAVNANADSQLSRTPHQEVLSHPVTARAIKDSKTADVYDKVDGNVTFPAGDHVTVYSQGTNGIGENISDASHPNGKNMMQYTYPLNDTKADVLNSFSNGSQSSQDQSSNGGSNGNNSEYQNQNTNHGKLVQTGEHSTARKAGIAAIVIALVAFVVFKARKVAKRN